MNRKQLLTLVAALVVVGAIGLLVQQRRRQTWQESGAAIGQKLYDQFPLNDITQVAITNKDGAVTLVKSGEQWVVRERADFPANFTEISDFLRKLWELKISQPVKASEAQLGKLELLAPGKGTDSGTLIEFKDKDGKLRTSLLLGKAYTKGGGDNSPFGGGGYPAGRYLMIPGKVTSVALVSEAFSNVGGKPDAWLSKDFIKVEKLSAIAVTHPEATNNWSLSRTNETADWVLADAKPGEDLDKSKVGGLGSFLAYGSFEDVVTGKADTDLGLDKPDKIALQTFEGFHYDLTVGHKDGSEDHFARFTVNADLKKERTAGKDEKPEDKTKLDKEFQDNLKKLEEKLHAAQALQKWTYKVSKWTLEAGLKNRSELFAEKKPEPAATTNVPPATLPPVEIPNVPEGK